MQDFLTRDNLGNFTFLLFVIVIATEFTKIIADKAIKRFDIKTEYIVFFYSFMLSFLKTMARPDIVWSTTKDCLIESVLIFINALIISYFASASYGKIAGDIKKFSAQKGEKQEATDGEK